MANKKRLDRNAPSLLFRPRFRNENDLSSDIFSKAPEHLDKNHTLFADTNIQSSASFRYGDKGALVSTQQLRVDYTKLENHTFFHSAVAKTNEAFDKIVNFYPIDGTNAEIEKFEDELTGYEKYVLDQFPKNIGYLNFSGTAVGEAAGNGTKITVNDREGTRFKNLSRKKSAKGVLDPKTSPFSISIQCRVPQQANDNQIIFQKRQSLANNFSLFLSKSDSTETAELIFGITSGSQYAVVSGSITKGSFTNVSVIYDPENDEKTKICIGTEVYSSSMSTVFDTLMYESADFTIGTGEQARINEIIYDQYQSFSGSIDELRYEHKALNIQDIKDTRYETVYPSKDLKLYYKFNEPNGSYGGKDIVLDSSHSGLHSVIENYLTTNTRVTGSDNPVKNELVSRHPVLFPDFASTVTLNEALVASGSDYDDVNPNLITKLIPPHYFLEANEIEGFTKTLGNLDTMFTSVSDGMPVKNASEIPSAALMVKFLLSWAKLFDEIKMLIDHVTATRHTRYEDYETTPDIFLKERANQLNLILPNLFSNAKFAQLINGINLSDDYANATKSLNEIQHLVWRRIISDSTNLKLTKGTIDSMKSVFRSAGIEPDNIMTFREYGGSKVRSLEGSRETKVDVLGFLNFSGSITAAKTPIDYHGYPTTLNPRLISPFLLDTRIEIGNPPIQGTMSTPSLTRAHGVSDSTEDGLLTSGSFTYEGLYAWDRYTGTPECLVRLHTTGTTSPASYGAVNTNLVASDTGLTLLIQDSPTSDSVKKLFLTGTTIFDGDEWYICFGRSAAHDAASKNRSNYFLRAGKQENGEILAYQHTSSHYSDESDSVFNNITSTYNSSGSFLVTGYQAFQGGSDGRFLNDTTGDVPLTAHSSSFSGYATNMRFWSKAITNKESQEHVKNVISYGVSDPKVNYNFNKDLSGSFERIRIRTDAKQSTTASNSDGTIRIFDFSQNNNHFVGSGFEVSKKVMTPRSVTFETLSDKFDLNIAKTKIRVRSYQDVDMLDEAGYARIAPVYEVPVSEEVVDDNRFSIDMSLQRGLNENIMRMFSDYTALDDALGRPNNIFGDSYPELTQLRNVFFNNVISRADLGKFRNIFKWIDNSFTDLIFSLVPRSTNFMGINFIYESHVLERHKLKYLSDEIYLKALPRSPGRGNLLLSQFVAKIKKA